MPDVRIPGSAGQTIDVGYELMPAAPVNGVVPDRLGIYGLLISQKYERRITKVVLYVGRAKQEANWLA